MTKVKLLLAASGVVGASLFGLSLRGGVEPAATPAPLAAAPAPVIDRTAPVSSTPTPPAASASVVAPPVVIAGSGRLRVVHSSTARSGHGPLRRYRVEVEGGLGLDAETFAADVHRILIDRRSWMANVHLSLQRVSSGPVTFRVVLASPATTDRLCGPFASQGRYSCGIAPHNASGRLVTGAVINSRRWLTGADAYAGRLPQYRQYLVNHEVGHALNHRHEICAATGQLAPVMMQQTKGVGACRPNPWPFPSASAHR